MLATLGPVMETRIKTFPERIKGGVDATDGTHNKMSKTECKRTER